MNNIELINTNLRRYTFESPKIKTWVEENSSGKCLNLFAGKTKLNIDEVRVDVDKECLADYHMDVLAFIKQCSDKFDTIILDPPYAIRKAMEMYKGNYSSKFKQIADEIPKLCKPKTKIISFGYHSTFLGRVRGYNLHKLCVFAHGGSQHCTIAIIEVQENYDEEVNNE
ncbi:MAG TPA: hypothetical protein HA367_08425 [Candidatus Methanofastidiosum sp.]|nr:hypothetical protein [Methanofastidiosum sp.]